MTRGLAYWILMLLWVVLALAWHFTVWSMALWGVAIIPFLLFMLLGWQVYGPPLRG